MEEKCIATRAQFYSLSSIWKRGLAFSTNTSSPLLFTTFWAQNILARSEVKEKLGLPLGQNLDQGGK